MSHNTQQQFLGDEHIDGISLVENPFTATKVRARLRVFAHTPPRVWGFLVNCHFPLSIENIDELKAEPYVVSPKPEGVRCLLYIDAKGEIFIENKKLNIFQLDRNRAPQLMPVDTVLDGIVVRKILRDENNREAAGKLTFFIIDAIRCKGVDLTQKNIQERISEVQSEVMEPRLDGIKNGIIRIDREIFGLDIAEYVDKSQFEDRYLTQQFEDDYEYPLRSFLFQPRNGSYICGNSESTFPKIFQWDERNIQEFFFRLKVLNERESTGELYALGPWKGRDMNTPLKGPEREEVKHGTIDLTEDLRNMDGSIIECRFVDDRWMFVRIRNDSELPNGKHAIEGKLRALKNPVTRQHLLAALL